jgi:hypothetical protein
MTDHSFYLKTVLLSPKALRFTIIACKRERDRLFALSQANVDEDDAADAANDGMLYDCILSDLRAAEGGA